MNVGILISVISYYFFCLPSWMKYCRYFKSDLLVDNVRFKNGSHHSIYADDDIMYFQKPKSLWNDGKTPCLIFKYRFVSVLFTMDENSCSVKYQ